MQAYADSYTCTIYIDAHKTHTHKCTYANTLVGTTQANILHHVYWCILYKSQRHTNTCTHTKKLYARALTQTLKKTCIFTVTNISSYRDIHTYRYVKNNQLTYFLCIHINVHNYSSQLNSPKRKIKNKKKKIISNLETNQVIIRTELNRLYRHQILD